MPRLSEALTHLQVGKKNFKNPEWWSAKHKLTREVKRSIKAAEVRQKPNLRFSYTTNSLEQPSADMYIRQAKAKVDRAEYAELAPWNPVFRKSKTIILFDKGKL